MSYFLVVCALVFSLSHPVPAGAQANPDTRSKTSKRKVSVPRKEAVTRRTPEPKRGAAAQKISANQRNSSRLRKGRQRLGRQRVGATHNPTAATRGAEKREIIVQAQAQPRPRAPSPTANPYEQAMITLQAVVARMAPATTGRAEVYFVVGATGQPLQVSVFGLSAEIDRALVRRLKTLRFPLAHAGQPVAKKLYIRNIKKRKAWNRKKNKSKSTRVKAKMSPKVGRR